MSDRSSSSSFSEEEEEYVGVFTENSFEKMKQVYNLTDEELETFKKVATIIIKREKQEMNIMDMHGQTYFVAIIGGFTEKGILTFRKHGHIIGNDDNYY